MKWLDSIPMTTLVLVSLMLGLAPFTPEPHLVEKVRMLMNGALSKPLDIFDLIMHGTPLMILTLKLIRESKKGDKGK